MQYLSLIEKNITDSIELKKALLEDLPTLLAVQKTANLIIESFRHNGKVMFCGNGGSAADAQHLAAELSGRYYFDRDPLNAEALHASTAYLTAVANDYSFEEIYSRLLKAAGQKGDVLIGISTSGNSMNIINAMKQAREQDIYTVALTGNDGGVLAEHCDIHININSTDTPRIQECHMILGHTICQIVESELFLKL